MAAVSIEGSVREQQGKSDKSTSPLHPSLLPFSARSGLAQRKCACGGMPGSDGECVACKAKRLARQGRSSSVSPLSSMAPPIVREGLRSPGQPLDAALGVYREPRFGHDLSRVRVHDGAQAAAVARSANHVPTVQRTSPSFPNMPVAGSNRIQTTPLTMQRSLQTERSNGDSQVRGQAEVGREGGPVSPEFAGRIQKMRGSGTPLADGMRTQMESIFGADFSDVRMHADGEANALNRSVSALAFTAGSDVFFSHSKYQPASPSGRQLLAHELTHVVQQRGMGGPGPLTARSAHDSYEQEAAAMEALVAASWAGEASAVDTPAALPAFRADRSPIQQLGSVIATLQRATVIDVNGVGHEEDDSDISTDANGVLHDAAGNVVVLRESDGAYVEQPGVSGGDQQTPQTQSTDSNAATVQTPNAPPAAVPANQSSSNDSNSSDLDKEYTTAVQMGDWQAAAEWLNAFNHDDIVSRLAQLSSAQVARLHQGSLDNPRVGPQSQVAQLSAPNVSTDLNVQSQQPNQSIDPNAQSQQPIDVTTAPGPPQLVQSFWGWVTEGNWIEAAETLNSFNSADIRSLLSGYGAPSGVTLDQAAINAAALADPKLGPESAVALATAAFATTQAAVSDEQIAQMDNIHKIEAALKSAIEQFPAAFGGQVDALLQPKAMAEFAAFTLLFAALQATPGGWATDLAVIGLEAYLIGPMVFQALQDLVDFFDGAINAQDRPAIQRAGKALADALGILGIGLLMKLLFHGGGAEGEPVEAPGGGAEIEPGRPPEVEPSEQRLPEVSAEERAFLDQTAPKEVLSPSELKAEVEIADRGPAESINEPPFTIKRELPNGHVIEETPDGEYIKRCTVCRTYNRERVPIEDPEEPGRIRELESREGWEEKTERGRDFDRAQAGYYEANQVRLTNGKVLDSYNDGEAIVSRKATQLARISEGTRDAMIDEFYDKYPPGAEIADTPTARAEYPHLIGKTLRGRWILEVEPQVDPVPEDFIEMAGRLEITIRDSDFKTLPYP